MDEYKICFSSLHPSITLTLHSYFFSFLLLFSLPMLKDQRSCSTLTHDPFPEPPSLPFFSLLFSSFPAYTNQPFSSIHVTILLIPSVPHKIIITGITTRERLCKCFEVHTQKGKSAKCSRSSSQQCFIF